ncbi:unnamed protein product [Bursaphelenchus xylophilus]|uniref:(pine wood nematode) hypothetical protein n=1 Tax=Bursaphelenchus xylophilus TaxID=6326 RepID=A0A7I8WYA9_BURXY|nr:unnamed protein product [Bursaphelenchus xylophilus]CAG9100487.1 unnamed protein product [Bursaphelenchus xylophilus]
MPRVKKNPNAERKSRMVYTEKDDMEMVQYFLERYRAGDPLAHKKQPRKLFEPYTQAKGWKQMPLAVESHFRRRVIGRKMYDMNLPANDFFILAYHFNLNISSDQKKLLEDRYECTVKINEHGELASAYDKNGEPLHLRVLADGERPEEAAELWAQSMARRRKQGVSRRASESDISSICSGDDSSEGEEENTTLQPSESTTVIYDHFHTVSPSKVKEEPMSDQEMTEESDSLVEPVDISRPNSGDSANGAYQNGGSCVAEESNRSTRTTLKERYGAVVRGALPPGMLDDLPMLKESKGCKKMIQMLKDILITINTGTEEDLKKFDQTHELVKSRAPDSSRVILTPRRHRNSQRQAASVAPQDLPNNVSREQLMEPVPEDLPNNVSREQLMEPVPEYDDLPIQNDIENNAETSYMGSTEAAVPDFFPDEAALSEELVQNPPNPHQYDQELPAATPNSRGPYHRPECRQLFNKPNGIQNIPNQANRVPTHVMNYQPTESQPYPPTPKRALYYTRQIIRKSNS